MNENYIIRDLNILDYDRLKQEVRRKHLFENILFESFYKPKLQWVDECFSILKQKYKSGGKLKTFGKLNRNFDFVEKLFGKYNCFIYIVDNAEGFDFTGYDSIRGGGYDRLTKQFEVYISESFLDNFIKENDLACKKAIISFKNTCIHENIHTQQYQNYKGIIKPLPHTEENDYYNVQEVQAYARQYAFLLKELELGDTETVLKMLIEEPIKIQKFLKKTFHNQTVSTFERYLNIRDTQPKLWRVFLREIYDYLTDEEDSCQFV